MKKLYSIVGLAFCLLAGGCTNLHEEILNEQDNKQVVNDPNKKKTPSMAIPSFQYNVISLHSITIIQ